MKGPREGHGPGKDLWEFTVLIHSHFIPRGIMAGKKIQHSPNKKEKRDVDFKLLEVRGTFLLLLKELKELPPRSNTYHFMVTSWVHRPACATQLVKDIENDSNNETNTVSFKNLHHFNLCHATWRVFPLELSKSVSVVTLCPATVCFKFYLLGVKTHLFCMMLSYLEITGSITSHTFLIIQLSY